MIFPIVFLLAMIQAPAVEVIVQNNLAAEAQIGAATIAPYKQSSLHLPADARALKIRTGGCDYAYAVPGPLETFRSDEFGPVKLYVSQEKELFFVPFDLEMDTPVAYLQFQQPAGFPLLPGKAQCGKEGG